jgi:HD-like signal output (HDOD) protein
MSSANLLLLALFLTIILIWRLMRAPKKNSGATRKPQAPKPKPVSQTPHKPRPGEFKVGGRDDAIPAQMAKQAPAELLSFKLKLADDLELPERQTVEKLVRTMPAPHPIQMRLVGGLDTPEELIETVVADAGLTASVLRTVNSAAFSLSAPITSVQHAITYLGVTVVKGLVAQAAFSERAPEGSPAQQARLNKIWKSARCASAIAQLLGQEFAISSLSAVSTNALFANLGDVAFASHADGDLLPLVEATTVLERVKIQQRELGVNAFILGGALAQYWGLPKSLAAGIARAGLPLTVPPTESRLKGDLLTHNLIIYLAGRMGDAIAYEGLSDVSDFTLEDSERVERFYLAHYFEGTPLSRLPDLLKEPGFRRKINRLILTLG